MDLYFRQIGETGPAIVILHGIFGSSDNWLTISKTIAACGYRVFAVDQRNHGQSPRGNDQDYQSMAADLRKFLSEHQLERPILVGHSMGGKTVMQYVMTYPGTFDKVVVVDIAPKFYPIHHAEIIRGLKAIDLAGYQKPDRCRCRSASLRTDRYWYGSFYSKTYIEMKKGGLTGG